jgi:ankyrin repeat domain-containing protein 50
MDPLSLTASLIAVVQVSQAVLLFCYQIRGQIKDANDEISRIITDVEALAATLDELNDILPTGSATPSGTSTTPLDNLSFDEEDGTGRRSASVACVSAMRSCETVLTELNQKLKPLARPGIKSKLKWPFESSSIQRKLEIIEKQKATLQLVLSAYHARMLGQQSHKIEDIQKQSKRAAILTWYKTSDPEQNHKVSRSKHEPDTAKWIFDIKDFRNWKDNSGESLWIHGIPGAGKTVLCSTIIDHMSQHYERDPSNRVVYFYFDFADNKMQTVANLLKSVVYQLIAIEEVIPESAASLYTKYNGLQEPSLDELLGVVIAEVSQTGRTFLIIDALDECPKEEREVFFETFVQGSLPNNLNVLITSREEPDIKAVLRPSFSYTICIQNAVIDADVRVHVGKAIARDARLLKWKPTIREEILEAIVDGSHGMYS